MKKIVLVFSIFIFSSYIVAYNTNFKLETPERSAESANSLEEYLKTDITDHEPKPKITTGSYFVEPQFIKAPKIVREDVEIKKDKKKTKLVGKRSKLKQIAERLLRNRARYMNINGRRVRIYNDCSNFVRSIYWKATGLDLFQESNNRGIRSYSGCKLLYAYMKKKRTLRSKRRLPKIGDIIFFSNTWDKNRNRRFDDPNTHVGIVTNTNKNGSVTFIHANTGRPKRIRKAFLNIKLRNKFRKGSQQVNSYLQARYRWDRRRRKSTAAELVKSFGGF